jgi:hypothetical protein
MSMGRDNVSEVRPPMAFLFIPQVINKHGESQWNHIDREHILIRPPELSGKHTSRHRIAKQEELARK